MNDQSDEGIEYPFGERASSCAGIKIAYVAGPYRDPRGPYYVGRNIERARRIAAQLWQAGYAVICPHTNTAHFDGVADDAAFLDGLLEIMRRADLVVLVPGWSESAGTRAEIEEALLQDIPVYRWPAVPHPDATERERDRYPFARD